MFCAISESQIKTNSSNEGPSSNQVSPINRPGGTILLPSVPSSGPSQQASSSSLGLQGHSHMSGGRLSREMLNIYLVYNIVFFIIFSYHWLSYLHTFLSNWQGQAFYGGRMTEGRLLAVKNATSEAIDHLHKSLESCPSAEAEAPDPKGLKVKTPVRGGIGHSSAFLPPRSVNNAVLSWLAAQVSLMAHQRRALAWLLWRETQKPCGGILGKPTVFLTWLINTLLCEGHLLVSLPLPKH